MTKSEKRALAVRRELDLLASAVKAFDQVVADAQTCAAECRRSLERLEAIERDQDVDEKIDNLDRLMRRGKYAPSDLSSTLVDIARTSATVVPFPVGPLDRSWLG